jgi:hypothetical protein
MSTFNNFVSTIRTNSIALQSHFIVDIQPPAFITKGADANLIQMVPFYCEGINLPEQALATRPVSDNGITREVAYEPLFGTVTATFFSDSSMLIKSFFDSWVGAVSMNRTGRLMYPDNYTCSVFNIYCFDRARNMTYMVTLKNAYPKIVDDVQMAANSTAPVSFRVQFVYETWDSYSFNVKNLPQDPKDSFTNIKAIADVVQLIRSGANKTAIKSLIINTGVRKISDIVNSTNIVNSVGKTVDSIIGSTGVGGAIEKLKGIIL